MTIIEHVSFSDPNGLDWPVERNSVVDGASIPRVLWNTVGSPFTGLYRDASVIHDVACQLRSRTWEVSHLAFYYAMRAKGVSEIQASIMYAGVYHRGPRWQLIAEASYPETLAEAVTQFANDLGHYDILESSYAENGLEYVYATWDSQLTDEETQRLLLEIEAERIQTLEEIRNFRP